MLDTSAYKAAKIDGMDCVSCIRSIYTANQDMVYPEVSSGLHLGASCGHVMRARGEFELEPGIKRQCKYSPSALGKG